VGSLRDLADKMERISKVIPVNVAKALKETVMVIDQAVVLATPVDTGRARSNWIVGTGPSTEAIDAYAPGKKGSSGGANADAALQQAQDFLSATDVSVIYISNNLSYIQYLNEGSSAQAPAGFIEVAVQAGIDHVKTLKVLSDG
jgi:bacteriophage HK97-gp10 putative tail-component